MASSLCFVSMPLFSSPCTSASSSGSSLAPVRFRSSVRFALPLRPSITIHRRALRFCRRRSHDVVAMAPEEEKMTRRSPLDFPIEWERPRPGRRPDIFPQFSPMKTPLPPPLPADPPEEDEEEEEKKEEEEEENPEKEEEPEKPEKQS
ncbi:hypothetical protein Sjap_011375 [Stephania japonica]|uniref:Uncharacterized protein n=1 Tax=Stephania japonica TaxID=461633 RepID=A0AAP0JBE2_9MAGN